MTTTNFKTHIIDLVGREVELTGTISAWLNRGTGSFEEYEITDLKFHCLNDGEKWQLSDIKSMCMGLYEKGTVKDIDAAAQEAWQEARSEELAEYNKCN